MKTITAKSPLISIIAAIGEHSEIGKNNQLLWHLPADFKHFKNTTMGKPIIMGRNTFESLPGGALPGRLNIVLSRQQLDIPDVSVVPNLNTAIELAQKEHSELMIIGGAMLYQQAMAIAGRLYITHVKFSDPKADAFFPVINPSNWHLSASQHHSADEKNKYDFTINTYERK